MFFKVIGILLQAPFAGRCTGQGSSTASDSAHASSGMATAGELPVHAFWQDRC